MHIQCEAFQPTQLKNVPLVLVAVLGRPRTTTSGRSNAVVSRLAASGLRGHACGAVPRRHRRALRVLGLSLLLRLEVWRAVERARARGLHDRV